MTDEREPQGSSQDAYEAAEMHDGSRVVHRDKLVSRAMTGLLLVPALFTLALSVIIPVMNASSERPVPPEVLPFVVGGVALLGLLLGTMSILFGVLRTVVTERALHIKYGMWGPTIELSKIRSARVVSYPLLKYGGWGIRRGIDGSWAYVGPAAGDVVEIEYDDEKGKKRKVVVGPSHPTALLAALQKARGAAGLRFAEPAEASSGEDAAAEAEALAEQEAAAAEARAKAG